MKIVKIDDFRGNRFLAYNILTGICGTLVTIAAALYLHGYIPLLTGSFAILFLLGFGLFLWRFNSLADQSKNSYREWIATHDKATLTKMVLSPELDEHSKTLISDFLNSRHPGWSIE